MNNLVKIKTSLKRSKKFPTSVNFRRDESTMKGKLDKIVEAKKTEFTLKNV